MYASQLWLSNLYSFVPPNLSLAILPFWVWEQGWYIAGSPHSPVEYPFQLNNHPPNHHLPVPAILPIILNVALFPVLYMRLLQTRYGGFLTTISHNHELKKMRGLQMESIEHSQPTDIMQRDYQGIFLWAYKDWTCKVNRSWVFKWTLSQAGAGDQITVNVDKW